MFYSSRFLRLEKQYMQGPDVAELQEKLARLGYYHDIVDGIFGLKTAAAVEAFQNDQKLPPDGIVDVSVWNKLGIYDPTPGLKDIEQKALGAPNIIVDIDKRILTFISADFIKTYPVAVGKKTTPTPLGNWTIVQKTVDPGGPFGVRWMRLSVPWGGYGIHGTNNPKSIGKAVSHGCIRLYNHDVIEVYDRTPLGTPVYIIGKAYANRMLKKGDRGTDVKEVQKMLKKLGYYKAKLDGYFGSIMEKAVINFQKDKDIIADGIVGPATLSALQKAYAIASGHQEP